MAGWAEVEAGDMEVGRKSGCSSSHMAGRDGLVGSSTVGPKLGNITSINGSFVPIDLADVEAPSDKETKQASAKSARGLHPVSPMA